MPRGDLLERSPLLGLRDRIEDVTDIVDLARQHVRGQDPLPSSAAPAARQPHHNSSITRRGLQPAHHAGARQPELVAAATTTAAASEELGKRLLPLHRVGRQLLVGGKVAGKYVRQHVRGGSI